MSSDFKKCLSYRIIKAVEDNARQDADIDFDPAQKAVEKILALEVFSISLTDEEIERAAEYYFKHSNEYGRSDAFASGAKWMRDKMKLVNIL